MRTAQQKTKCTRAVSWLNGDRLLVSRPRYLFLFHQEGMGGMNKEVGRLNGILVSAEAGREPITFEMSWKFKDEPPFVYFQAQIRRIGEAMKSEVVLKAGATQRRPCSFTEK